MSDIIQYTEDENNVLRTEAEEVPLTDITSTKIQSVISNMKSALKAQDDGVAIAAPQIGAPLRIFVVSGKVFDSDVTDLPGQTGEEKEHPDLVFINPTITKLSKKMEEMEEGCLSVRWLYGKVDRYQKATVEAYNENGLKFSRGGSGLLAQIFQHETDHLDGVLFIDKARDVHEYEPHE